MAKFGLIGYGTISKNHVKAIESIGGKMCDFGCGREAKFTLKNGKRCCSPKFNSCQKIKERNSRSNKGKKLSEETKQKILEKWLINPPRLGKTQSEKSREKISESIKNIWKDQTSIYNQQEVREKNRLSIMGKTHTKDGDVKISKKLKGRVKSEQHKQKLRMSIKKSYEKNPILKEEISKRMKDWQCKYMLKKVKTISKEEIKLREITKDVFPTSVFHYKVLENRNFEVDIALIEYKIAIEYDGYYHFNCQKSIDYHKQRQKLIEKEGWKFLRYSIYDKFPSKEQIQKDISRILS